MKRYGKSELISVVETLERENEVFEVDEQNLEEAFNMLAQCQETALALGSFLETYGESTQDIISLLEVYCEYLYRMNIELCNVSERKNIANEIALTLQKTKGLITEVLPDDKKRIAFFVYKASMWDSMESIWEAAYADDRCETYVVPIPYFDKLEDGTLTETHYEGGDLPTKVPTEDWREFNPEEFGIDVAYIHNPYDDMNSVTCVHPCFFSSHISKYVEKLVYVPYFATLNYVEEHFCILPGVLCADIVVLQTEDIKQIYLENLQKFEQENNLSKLFSQNMDKFMVLGSPKFDKVLSLQKEDFDIPEDWKRTIWRKDGSKRKVLLFNTSLQELLTYGEDQLKKIEQVIEMCHTREDIVLLWRPHPLSKSTIRSMLPGLFENYQKLEERFRKMRWGIFDDTADLYRALAVSDAYYGTGGSLIPLFGLTGKPIMKENAELPVVHNFDERRLISMAGVYVDMDGSMWFSAVEFNGLFQYDMVEKCLKWKGEFPNEWREGRYRYCSCIEYQRKLFFAPYAAKEIAIYDMESGKFDKLAIKDYGVSSQKIYATVKYGKKWFCFGARIPAVLCVDLETYEIEYYEKMHAELVPFFTNTEIAILNRDVIAEGDVCWLVCGRANIVVEFHMDSMTYAFHRVGKSENYYAGMRRMGNEFYLFPRNKANVVCWDYKKKTEYEVLPAEGEECVANAYSNSCVYGDEMFLFAYLGQWNARIKKGEKAVETLKDMQEYAKSAILKVDMENFSEQKISWAYSDEKSVYFFSFMNKTLYIRNMQTGEEERHCMEMTQEDYVKARVLPFYNVRGEKKLVQQFIFQEKEDTSLADYLEWISNSEQLYSGRQVEVFLQENAGGHVNCGQMCHKKIDMEE